ncbi:MAG: hypothetical protein JKY10_04195, partial [Cohaesibacteraceae bacterium]|nr:hypothetical protein [Cohaesibacteraceae bacterium]
VIRQWIDQVQTKREIAAAKRTPIDHNQILEAIRTDLNYLSEAERARTRYFSLHHLYNAGDSNKQLEQWRRSLSKVINSLSWQSTIVPGRLGPKKLLLRVNLDDLNWPDILWDRLLSVYPYGIEPEDTGLDVARRANTPQVFIRADWFAHEVTKPPLYYEILGLPRKTAVLEEMLQVHVIANINRYRAKRAAFRESGVSQNNRLIERHPMSGSPGSYWKSYDFAGNRNKQDLFKNPLGRGLGKAKFHFKHDGGEIIFSLPNGMQAYYLETADGIRIDTGPTDIVRDKTRPDDPDITSGVSCMNCHKDGMILTADQVRDRYANRPLPIDVRRAINELYVPWNVMRKTMFKDMRRYLSALDDAEVIKGFEKTSDGSYKVDRIFPKKEAVRHLTNRYEQVVSMLQAAGEVGLTLEEFSQGFEHASEETRNMKEELERGTMPRDVFEDSFHFLLEDMLRLKSLSHGEACQEAFAALKPSKGYREPLIESCGGDHIVATSDNKGTVTAPPVITTKPEPPKHDKIDQQYAVLSSCLSKAKIRSREKDKYQDSIDCVNAFRKSTPTDSTNKYSREAQDLLGGFQTSLNKWNATETAYGSLGACLESAKGRFTKKSRLDEGLACSTDFLRNTSPANKYSSEARRLKRDYEQQIADSKVKTITKPPVDPDQKYYTTLKACLRSAANGGNETSNTRSKIRCAESYQRNASRNGIYSSEVRAILADQKDYLTSLTTPTDVVPDGTYWGERGYTDSGRRSPSNNCLSRYTFRVRVANGRLTFSSDNRYWNGRINSNGYITIDRTDISPAPKQGFSIRGQWNNATMRSNYCGGGFFRLQ